MPGRVRVGFDILCVNVHSCRNARPPLTPDPRRTRMRIPALATIAVAVLALATPSGASAPHQPDPRPIKGFAATHDPSMVRLADGSCGAVAAHEGVEIYGSRDRVHWRYRGEALPNVAPWADAYQNG